MNILLLSPQAALGGLCIFLLFLFCFFSVHLVKLAKRGLEASKLPEEKRSEPEKKVESEKKATPPEPVYYIVERKKKKRPSTSYSEPKKISFKE